MKYDFIEKGEGKAIIMLHGMFGSASNWDTIIDILSLRYRTIALELPYLNLAKDECNVEYLADYVLGFADSERVKKAVYMGNSLGGHIAIDVALKNHNRVGRLILTGSSGLFERGYESDFQIHPTRDYLRKKIEEIFFDKNRVTDEMVEEAYNLLLNRRNKLKIVRLSKSAKGYNVKKNLHRINCPTLLIWGRNDTITPPRVAREFKENIRNSRLEFINECCHAPMMERPEAFSGIVSDFLLNSA